MPRLIKKELTPNEEIVDYDGKIVIYTSKNKAYIYELIKQIKYPLILKDGNGPSIFYQYGNTHVMIMIDIYKKTDRGGSISINEK
ncbi:hypothetical protein AAFN85_04885 [Mucilaginibacter sp. CAU 1740]|uniref:hypothetical protein n=1 Tax=Mucilaginibacter sp. CAU 1740 TaxID=3140365 RepID=UPI00325B668F